LLLLKVRMNLELAAGVGREERGFEKIKQTHFL
jgi:hypothetical protein